jgi:hypothetical protein
MQKYLMPKFTTIVTHGGVNTICKVTEVVYVPQRESYNRDIQPDGSEVTGYKVIGPDGNQITDMTEDEEMDLYHEILLRSDDVYYEYPELLVPQKEEEK